MAASTPKKRKPGHPPRGYATTTHTPDYTPDELEFFKAMDRFKREKCRPFPTCAEILEVVRSLGYRKVG
jgi:hypothetical protein